MPDIQWYPGHMAKAKRLIQQDLTKVDIVWVLLDARLPLSSFNPEFRHLLKHKPQCFLLNKSDKVSDEYLKKALSHFHNQQQHALAISASLGKGLSKLVPLTQNILKPMRDKAKARGLKERPMRVMIVGLPNTGKSTLINRMVHKKSLAVADRPGVTRQLQWITMHEDLLLLDTPGLLWPKFDDQSIALKLALVGTIKDTLVPLDDMVFLALDYFKSSHSTVFLERYQLKEYSDPTTMLESIAHTIGALSRGGQPDYDKTMQRILTDLRHDKLGPIMLDALP